MAKTGGQILRADKDRIDALDGDNFIDIFDTGTAFNLHHDRDAVVDLLQVILDRAELAAAMHQRDTPHALRRVACGGDGTFGVRLAFDVRDDEVVEADVEQALDQHRVIPLRAHDGCADAILHGGELRNEGGNFVGRVLAVDDDPVKTGEAEHLGHDGAGHRAPATDQTLTSDQALAKAVGDSNIGGGLHQDFLFWFDWESRGRQTL